MLFVVVSVPCFHSLDDHLILFIFIIVSNLCNFCWSVSYSLRACNQCTSGSLRFSQHVRKVFIWYNILLSYFPSFCLSTRIIKQLRRTPKFLNFVVCAKKIGRSDIPVLFFCNVTEWKYQQQYESTNNTIDYSMIITHDFDAGEMLNGNLDQAVLCRPCQFWWCSRALCQIPS